jgi:hypothetical protein
MDCPTAAEFLISNSATHLQLHFNAVFWAATSDFEILEDNLLYSSRAIKYGPILRFEKHLTIDYIRVALHLFGSASIW